MGTQMERRRREVGGYHGRVIGLDASSFSTTPLHFSSSSSSMLCSALAPLRFSLTFFLLMTKSFDVNSSHLALARCQASPARCRDGLTPL